MQRSKDALGAEVVRLLRKVRNVGGDREQKTVIFRQIAKAAVDLREHFLTPESAPDWAGRTGAYRDYIRDLYREAGLSAEETNTIQSAVRYHAGNLVRERLSEPDLQDLGLSTQSPAARIKAFRDAQSMTLRVVRNDVADLDADADPLSRLALVLMHLQALTPEDLAPLDAGDVRLAAATLDGIAARARGLRRGLRGAEIDPM